MFRKSFSFPTYLKYFFSYMTLLSILLFGFFYIIKTQFIDIYLQSTYAQAQQQINNFSDQLDDLILNLTAVDNSIHNDAEIHYSSYKTDSFKRYTAYQELQEYASCCTLINSIVFFNKNSNTLITTLHRITYNDGTFSIHMESSSPNNEIVYHFNPHTYYNHDHGKLIHLSHENNQLLLYFPPQHDKQNYILFYTLDTAYIYNSLKALINNETIAAAFLDSKGSEVVGYNTSLFSGYLDSALTEGIFPVEDASLCVFNGINNEYSLVTLLSDNYINEEVKKTVISVYIFLAVLGLLGFLVIFAMMQITYKPLYKLAHRVLGDYNHSKDHFQDLEQVFTDSEYQTELLTKKLNNYRIFYQKSLLNSQINLSPSSNFINNYNLDDFFDGSPEREFFLFKIQTNNQESININYIINYFDKNLPEESSVILLEENFDHAFFLLNYKSFAEDRKNLVKKLLVYIFEELNYNITISTGTNSPLDIPVLYESIIDICKKRPQDPIVECPPLSPVSINSYKYPNEILDQLSCSFLDKDFKNVRINIDLIFEKLEYYKMEDNSLSEFSIRCILIDMISIIVSHMTREHISFRAHNDSYFEILNLCLRFPYQEKSADIIYSIHELIDFYEQKILNKLIKSENFAEYINLHYCNPDFTLTMLADHFNISQNHMSYLFKKELNMNFSDYLWTLRLNKAKDLLATTDMTVDEISIKVGYINPSSFRRKFKQETGISPSQLREEYLKKDE